MNRQIERETHQQEADEESNEVPPARVPRFHLRPTGATADPQRIGARTATARGMNLSPFIEQASAPPLKATDSHGLDEGLAEELGLLSLELRRAENAGIAQLCCNDFPLVRQSAVIMEMDRNSVPARERVDASELWRKAMTRRERKLAERKLTPRDRDELLEKLGEQRQLLRLGAEIYDADPENTVVGLQLATTLRVLLHDTGASSSLLGLLGLKRGLLFVDTALPVGALAKTQFSPGLVSLEIAQEGRGMRWIPVLDHLPENREGRRCEFQPWWERACNRDIHGNTWSRREFVLYLANKEGGAHVDAGRREPKFEALDRSNSMGWSIEHSEAGRFYAGSPVPASIRQITHEVAATLDGLDPQQDLGAA